jgi:hypothetical protein
MTEQTYLYSYGSGPWGASSTRRTKAYILAQPKFSKVHPEHMRRLFALCDEVIKRGGDYGFGGGWRDSSEQLNLFLSRYDKYSTYVSSSFWWDGRPTWNHYGFWKKKSGVASSAPPGRSYHESTDKDGYALAVDMVGDHKIGNALAAEFGVRHFANVNSEPWHYQPLEIPNARINYKNEILNTWKLPGESDGPVIASNFQFDKKRLLDTRTYGNKTAAGQVITLGVPANAVAAKINITSTEPTGAGYVTAYPAETARPNTSDLNYKSDTICNQVDVPTKNGLFSLYVLTPTHLIVDLVGFWY